MMMVQGEKITGKVIRQYDSKYFKSKTENATSLMLDDFKLHPKYSAEKNYVIQKHNWSNDRDTMYDVIEL